MSRSMIVRALPLAAAVVALAAIPASSATKVRFPADCGKPSYKPASIVVACGDANNQLTHIKWESYGTQAASGTATARVNACDPNCAQGKTKSYPAVVTLTRPKKCGKVMQFTRLRETFTHSKPKGYRSALVESFPCSG